MIDKAPPILHTPVVVLGVGGGGPINSECLLLFCFSINSLVIPTHFLIFITLDIPRVSELFQKSHLEVVEDPFPLFSATPGGACGPPPGLSCSSCSSGAI